jgi:hypothetical protein
VAGTAVYGAADPGAAIRSLRRMVERAGGQATGGGQVTGDTEATDGGEATGGARPGDA